MKKRILKKGAALLLTLVLLCSHGTPAAKGETFDAEGEGGKSKSTESGSPGEENKSYSSEEIENNGGFFVRVGNKIYFRRYGQQTLESSALFGQFLEYSQPGENAEKSSAMLAYDIETGEVTEIFEDSGYGRLFAGDGGFYCKRTGDGYGNTAYWISYDGSQSVDLALAMPVGIGIQTADPGQGESEEIAAVTSENTTDKNEAAPAHSSASISETDSENPENISSKIQGNENAAFLALQDQNLDHFGELFILREGRETARTVPGEDESLEFCGMTGEYAIYLLCDTKNKTNHLYSLSGKSGEAVCLGEMPIDKEQFYDSNLEAGQFLSDEKGVYLVASCYQGTGHFLTYSLAVSAVPGTADSLKLLASRGFSSEESENENESDSSEGEGELSPPILFLTAPGEADVVPGPAGTAGLSEIAYGDLVYYDSPFSALELLPDYISEEEWRSPERKFLQTAEVIGDAVYLIAAHAVRNEEEDIGWRMSYKLKGLDWLRVPIAAGFPDSGEEGETTLLTQESY